MGANFSEGKNLTAEDQELVENNIVPKPWMYILIFFHCVVFVIGLFGNIMVCVAVYRNHSMRTVTNYFIVNLAVADALVILFCLPFSVVWDVTSTWWFGTNICKFILNIQNVSINVSILTLTFISIDRWYAICRPLKFRPTTGKTITAICIIWVVSVACEIPQSIYLVAVPYKDFDIYFTQCQPTYDVETDVINMITRMVMLYFVPLLFMSIAYIQIIKILWKSDNGPHRAALSSASYRSTQSNNTFSMNMNTSTEGQLRSRRKAAKMLVTVVIVFAICIFPVHLLEIIRQTLGLQNSERNRAFSMICHWLCYANSAVNPIIYNIMSGKFRQEFKSLFSKCRKVNRPERNFNRHSTYIYRYTTTTNRTSSKSKSEIIPLAALK